MGEQNGQVDAIEQLRREVTAAVGALEAGLTEIVGAVRRREGDLDVREAALSARVADLQQRELVVERREHNMQDIRNQLSQARHAKQVAEDNVAASERKIEELKSERNELRDKLGRIKAALPGLAALPELAVAEK
jgi:chromosome segregation ATPase